MKPFENHSTLFRSTLIAAALAAGLGAAGTSRAATGDSAQPQPQSENAGAAITDTDTAITEKVKARFLGESRLQGARISVTTTNGAVTLSGSLENSELKAIAVALATGVEGVKSVTGEGLSFPAAAMTGSPAAPSLEKATEKAISDSLITAKVKSEILADSVSKGFEVSVTTKHGVVMLSGNLASHDAIEHVKDVAEKVAGVKSVDTSGLSASGG